MSNPFHRLKFLPWQCLLIVAGLTTAIALVADFLLWFGVAYVPGIRQTAMFLLFTPLLREVVSIGLAVFIGALAVLLLERLYPQISITVNVLWALLGCLMLSMFLASFLAVQLVFVSLGEYSLVGWLLGIFLLRGKRYWR